MRWLLGALLLTAALGGCLGDDASDTAIEPATQGGGQAGGTPPTVIAVIDSGINPYHAYLQGGPSPDQVPAIADQARPIELALDAGSYDQAVAADEAAWQGIQAGELVWFPGTRVAGVSLAPEHADSVPGPILDDDGHGTVVGHTAIEAAPHAVLLMVEIDDDEQLVDAMAWLSGKDWVDVVSVSWGNNPPEYAEGEVLMGLPEAYRQAHASGKLILNAAGNLPVPHLHGEHHAPPFIVAVGGAQNHTHGESVLASKLPDVVSDFQTPGRATHASTTETRTAAGTSLATPRVAGTVAEALWLVRDAGQDATPAELRAALNQTAVLWEATGYQADPPEQPDDLVGASTPVLAPPAQMGWGYVGPGIAPAMAGVLLGQDEVPEKGPEVQAAMQANLAARQALWNR